MRMIKIGASLICADLANIEREMIDLELAGIDYYHLDVMDGSFVRNFGLGYDTLIAIRKLTTLPILVHLMISAPERHVNKVMELGANTIAFHPESTEDSQKIIRKIQGGGGEVFLCLSPEISIKNMEDLLPQTDGITFMCVRPGNWGQKALPGMRTKLEETTRFISEKVNGAKLSIEVDGNVSLGNIPWLSKSGADMYVAGTSSIFKKNTDYRVALKSMRQTIINNLDHKA